MMVRCVLLCHGKFIRYICFAKLLKTFLINYSGRFKSGNNDHDDDDDGGVCSPFWRKPEIGCFIRLSLLYVSVWECFFSLALLIIPLHSLLSCYHIPRRFLALYFYACQEFGSLLVLNSFSLARSGSSFTMIFFFFDIWTSETVHKIIV